MIYSLCNEIKPVIFFKYCKKLYKNAIVRLYDPMCTHWLYSIQQFQLIPIFVLVLLWFFWYTKCNKRYKSCTPCFESKIQSHGFGYSFFLFILIFTVFTKMTRAYVKKEVLENFQKEKKRKEKKKKWENQNRPTPTLKSKKMFKWHVSSSTWYVSNFIKFGLIILTNYDVI